MPRGTVSVLIMAKKDKKNKKDGAGDVLFGRLGRNSAKKQPDTEEDFLDEEVYTEEYDSIDITGENSDSDLDINELLRKYMPEYSDEEKSAGGSGVLSRLKQTKADAEQAEQEPDRSDDMLISALDSAFSSAVTPTEIPEEVPAESEVLSEETVTEEEDLSAEMDFTEMFEEEVSKKDTRKKGFRLFGAKNKRRDEEELISEYEFEEEISEPLPEEDEDDGESLSAEDFENIAELTDEELLADEELLSDASLFNEEITEEETALFAEEEEKKSKKKKFGFGFGRKKKFKGADAELADLLAEEGLLMAVEKATAEEPDGPNVDNMSDEELLSLVRDAVETVEEEVPEPVVEEVEEPTTEIRFDLGETTLDENETGKDVAPSEETTVEEDDDSEESIDSTDINLMVAFGMDGEKGGRKAGRAKELGDRLEARQHSHDQQKVQLDRPEFVDKTQTPKIRKEFRNRSISLVIKLGLAVVFTVLLMVFENIEVLSKLFTGSTKQFGGAFDPAVYPTVYIMVSLQLMLLACLCAYEQILEGFKFLFRGVPKPETMLSVMAVVGILYSVILIRVNTGEPVMFNFMVALAAVFALIYAIYNHKRTMLNFRIVANKRAKHIVRRIPDELSEGEARAFEDNDEVCDVMKIEKTDFIDGFFGRLSKPDATTTRFMVALLSAVGAIAVVFGILMKVRGGETDTVLGAVYATLLLVAPLSIYMTFSYPFYRANLAAKEYDSAIIGDTSLEEYSNASIISFDDKNVFPAYSVKVQNIRIYNNARIDRVLYYAASVFAYAGGPLQDVFEVATVEMGHSSNVKIFDTENGLLATQVDGVNITFGSYETLSGRGLHIPDDAVEDDVDLSDELAIMYMFREDKLFAKLYVKYVMDADIDLILKQFAGSGLYVCVRTFDPNIDEKMIARKLNMKKMPLRIVRYASPEEVTAYEEKVDSGLVTCGTPKSLLQVISYCEKVLRARKTNIALSVLSVLIGAGILTLLLLSDSMGLLNSLYIAIYQFIWLIPLSIASRMFIR